MADKKITELSELTTTLEQSDLIVVVDDPSGTPVTKKQQKRNFQIRYAQMQPFSMRDEEPCSSGDGKAYMHIPPDINGLDLVYCHAEVKTAGSSGVMEIMVYNVTQAANMLTETIQVDSGETGSDTAGTSYSIDTSNDDVSTNDLLRLDFDAIHSSVAAKGCLVTLGFA